MHVDTHDSRTRWIVIGGAMGALFGANAHHVPIATALGIGIGMSIGALLNRIRPHLQH